MNLRKATADDQGAGVGRQFFVAKRIDDHHLATRRGEQLDGLCVAEGECIATGHGDYRMTGDG